MILPLLLFAIGLVLLLKGADITVGGARSLASRFGISPALIGLTVVAFGTSLPELVVTSEAFRGGNFDIGIGNIIGSNIANIALVLGLYGLLQPGFAASYSRQRNFLQSTALMLLATGIFALLALRGIYDFYSGILILTLFAGILVMLWRSGTIMEMSSPEQSSYPALFTVVGIAAVIIGAHLLLIGVVEIAEIFAIPPVVIGLSMVAIGTSLPELATTIVAAYRNSPGIAVGNILGSNIFNLLFVLGLNALFIPIPSPEPESIGLLLLATIAIIPLFSGRRIITRIWGGLLVCSYVVYIISLYRIF